MVHILIAQHQGIGLNELVAILRHEIQGIDHRIEDHVPSIHVFYPGILIGTEQLVLLAKVDLHSDLIAQYPGSAHDLYVFHFDVFNRHIVHGLRLKAGKATQENACQKKELLHILLVYPHK
jgi:hypothetical protein